jgi:hypothetical protein
MKRLLLILASLFILCYPCSAKNTAISPKEILLNQKTTVESKDISIFFAKYLNTLNAHDIKRIGNFYSSNYTSTDKLTKLQMIDLIKNTWESCPDIKYYTTVKSIKADNNKAIIEFEETITATTKNKSDITKDKGIVSGKSINIFYLEKCENGWLITSDKITAEESTVKYGAAKLINSSLDVPLQAVSGETYTASLKTDMPQEIFAIASISSVPIIYPAKKAEEVFRQVEPGLNILERVIKSNKNGFNELVSASISYCEAQRNSYTNLDIKTTGLAVIIKRVNVVPKK